MTQRSLLDPFLGSDSRRALWRCAQMDPPWAENGGGGRGAQEHYGTLNVRQIRAVILGSGLWRPFPDAHLWCWYTDNFLQDALWLVGELGFRYVRQFHWVKVAGRTTALDFETGLAVADVDGEINVRTSLGQYGRSAHESMLFCVRGRGLSPEVMTDRRDVPSIFFAPVPKDAAGRRIHSRKPDAAYQLIEARSKGPHYEFFARRGLPGWTAWGNEAPEDTTT